MLKTIKIKNTKHKTQSNEHMKRNTKYMMSTKPQTPEGELDAPVPNPLVTQHIYACLYC